MRSVKPAHRPAYLAGDIVEITGDKNYNGRRLFVVAAESGDYYAGVLDFVPRPEDGLIRFQRRELGKVVGNFR